jgi:chaperone BCS1
MSIWSTLTTLAQNPVFSGVVGGGFVASIFYSLKSVPAQLWAFFRRWFTISLTIKGAQSFYPVLNEWIAEKKFSEKATRLQLTSESRDLSYGKRKAANFTLGFGNHFLWIDRRPVWVYRERTDKSTIQTSYSSAFTDETVTITTIGRNQKIIRKIISEAIAIDTQDDKIAIACFEENGYGMRVRRTKRALNSIFIPDDQMQRIVHDLERFYENKDLYAKRGTPHRRGYQFRGQPGTGKTSLIFALASRFEKRVNMINLANIGGDAAFMNAINQAGDDCFIVIEDIDSIGVTHDRDKIENKSDLKDEQNKGTLTLAGILNAIDGIASPEGRVLFITSNHAEVLDPALVRPGRIDMNEEILPLDADLALKMVRNFHPQHAVSIFEEHVRHLLPIPAANLQNIMLQLD